MYRQLGKLEINQNDDYYDEIVKALETAGFILVLTSEISFEKHYIVAKERKEQE